MSSLRSKKIYWGLFLLSVIAVMFPQGGCQYGGLVSVIGTESQYEKKIPAEYDLTKQTDKKLLVIVDQPSYITSEVNLRYHLTKAIHNQLATNAKIPPDNIITYGNLAEFRSGNEDFPFLSPAQAGAELGADLVLLVVVTSYNLNEIPNVGCYRGLLHTQNIIYDTNDTADDSQLWPTEEKSRTVRVGFEAQCHGRDMALARLVNSAAFCTVRYFYDCSKVKFAITDDKSGPVGIHWDSW